MDDIIVSATLKKVRRDHGLTQQDVASVLGVDRTTYTFYETGKTLPSVPTIKKLAKMYACSIDYLVNGEQMPDERIKINRVAMSSDPASELEKDEQLFLMCYRLIPEEKREEALKVLRSFAE